MRKQLISGKVTGKHSMIGMITVEGVGKFSIPSYLLKDIKVGRYYTLTLSYSPFLNCIAIMEVKKVFYFKSITNLAVDLIKNWTIPLFN